MLLKIKRIYIQASSAVFWNLPFLALYLKYIPAPVLNCYACPLAASACPLGTLQLFIYTGQIPYYTLAFLGIYGLFLGRTFCGYLCPFGWLQELLFKTNKKEIHLPHWTGYLKYAVLLIFVGILPVIYLSPVFCKICPAGTLEAALPVIGIDIAVSSQKDALSFGVSTLLGMIGFLFYLKILILLIFLGLFLFIKRPFCRLCPLGAIFSFFPKLSLFNKNTSNLSACKKTDSCGNCVTNCPAGINPLTDYLSKNCLQCNECKKTRCSR